MTTEELKRKVCDYGNNKWLAATFPTENEDYEKKAGALAGVVSDEIDRLTAQLAAAVQRAERAEGERDEQFSGAKSLAAAYVRLREENARLLTVLKHFYEAALAALKSNPKAELPADVAMAFVEARGNVEKLLIDPVAALTAQDPPA